MKKERRCTSTVLFVLFTLTVLQLGELLLSFAACSTAAYAVLYCTLLLFNILYQDRFIQ